MSRMMDHLPMFRVKGQHNPFYFVQIVQNNRIMSWERKGLGDLSCEIVWPKDVEGGRSTLIEIGVWNKLSEQDRLVIDKNIEGAAVIPVDVVTQTTIEQPVVESPVTVVESTSIPVIPVEQPVQKKRGRPAGSKNKSTDQIKVIKPVTMIKLVDGTVVPRPRGRYLPMGSIIVT